MTDQTRPVLETSVEPLLAAGEPAACESVNVGEQAAPWSSVTMPRTDPRRLGSLGLGLDDLATHIAWDPGAAEVARRLAELLDAPLVLSGYSRLVVDCNRPLNARGPLSTRAAAYRARQS